MSSSKILILHGDTFQVELERDKYIKNLRNKVNFEREIFFTKSSSFQWSNLLSENEDSLFPVPKILDLRIESPPLKDDSEYLVDLCMNISEEKYIVISISNIERLKTRAWFKSILNYGKEIELKKIWPNKKKEWIRNSAKNLGIDIDINTLDVIFEKTQGNLLAAYQEIKMIKMMGKNSSKVFVENSSEFDIFNLCNSLVSEKIDLSIEIINNLKSQKGSEALIVWGIFRELERLSILKEDSQAKLNGPFDYLESLSRKSKKINFNDLDDLKKKTALLDRNFKKGQGNFWFDLENLIIEFCQPKFH